ncbi:MAG: metalloregulator ArsR/SmtB family transcription factor [Candidatus Paceibacterota bacterium]
MNKKAEKLQQFLKILSDESRYKIILHLMKGEECVCTIAEKLDLERTLVSHHLNTLRNSGLIHDRKVGTWIHCSLNKKTFEEMERLYQKYLNHNRISDKPCTSHEICKSLII